MLIYQRQYARHYVIAQMRRIVRDDRWLIVEIARPNDISATLDTHIFKSLDGGELCGSS